MPTPKIRIAVAISGAGRSLHNLIQQSKLPSSLYEIVGVIGSTASCKGMVVAKEESLPTFSGKFTPFSYPEDLDIWIQALKVDWIFLAGFLKVFPILERWENRIVNIHPALLPKFGGKGMYGARVHQAVIDSRESVTGATVHIVTEEYDKGPILAQIKMKVDTTSPKKLAADVFAGECDLYPKVANWLADRTLPAKKPIIYQQQD